MSKKRVTPQYERLSGKIGGLAVKGMIREIEEQMARGETINAGPYSQAESELLASAKGDAGEDHSAKG